jgi:hypothetical protein
LAIGIGRVFAVGVGRVFAIGFEWLFAVGVGRVLAIGCNRLLAVGLGWLLTVGGNVALDRRFQPVRGELLWYAMRTEQRWSVVRNLFVSLVSAMTVPVCDAGRHRHAGLVIVVVARQVMRR